MKIYIKIKPAVLELGSMMIDTRYGCHEGNKYYSQFS